MRSETIFGVLIFCTMLGCGRSETASLNYDVESNKVVEYAKGKLGPGAGAQELSRKLIQTDVDGDGGADRVLTFELGVGSSSLSFVALLRAEGTEIRTIGPYRLGELLEWGVELESIQVERDLMKLNVFQYEPGDPSCCPSTKGRVTYQWKDGKLEDIGREVLASANPKMAPPPTPPAAAAPAAGERAQFRGLSLGMGVAELLWAELGGGTIRATPAASVQKALDFLPDEPDRMGLWKVGDSCVDQIDAIIKESASKKPVMETVSSKVTCPFLGWASIDSTGRVAKLNLTLSYFSADHRTTPESFMDLLMEAYEIEEFVYLGRTDDSHLMGRGAYKDTWEGVAGSGETFTVWSSGLGVMLEVERRESAQFK